MVVLVLHKELSLFSFSVSFRERIFYFRRKPKLLPFSWPTSRGKQKFTSFLQKADQTAKKTPTGGGRKNLFIKFSRFFGKTAFSCPLRSERSIFSFPMQNPPLPVACHWGCANNLWISSGFSSFGSQKLQQGVGGIIFFIKISQFFAETAFSCPLRGGRKNSL